MTSKNIPLNVPHELSKEIANTAKNLNLPQAQCMRLAIQYGLPELSKRLSSGSATQNCAAAVLPKVAARPWSKRSFAGYDLDQSIELGDLDEDLL
jgi:hypothetical protein